MVLDLGLQLAKRARCPKMGHAGSSLRVPSALGAPLTVDLGSIYLQGLHGIQGGQFAIDTGAPLAVGVHCLLIWGPI